MNSVENNQNYGLYRQGLDNSPPSDDSFKELLPIYLEIRRVLTYTGLIRPDQVGQEAELAHVQIGSSFKPVPGVWVGLGIGAPGTPVYYHPSSNSLSLIPELHDNSAFLAGITDANNNLVCTGIRRLPMSS